LGHTSVFSRSPLEINARETQKVKVPLQFFPRFHLRFFARCCANKNLAFRKTHNSLYLSTPFFAAFLFAS
jgi:hypothetical protein